MTNFQLFIFLVLLLIVFVLAYGVSFMIQIASDLRRIANKLDDNELEPIDGDREARKFGRWVALFVPLLIVIAIVIMFVFAGISNQVETVSALVG